MNDVASFFSGLLTGGGLVTLWKWLAGWNKPNLSLSLDLKRTPALNESSDHLICLVKLKKGNRTTLTLQSIRVLITADGEVLTDEVIAEVNISEESRTLNITPGEEAQFAVYRLVSKEAVCKVTATVTARSLKTLSPLSVWKATNYSVHSPPSSKANAP